VAGLPAAREAADGSQEEKEMENAELMENSEFRMENSECRRKTIHN
jgi:hypothetical protein